MGLELDPIVKRGNIGYLLLSRLFMDLLQFFILLKKNYFPVLMVDAGYFLFFSFFLSFIFSVKSLWDAGGIDFCLIVYFPLKCKEMMEDYGILWFWVMNEKLCASRIISLIIMRWVVGEAGLGRPSGIVRRRQAVGHLNGEIVYPSILRWLLFLIYIYIYIFFITYKKKIPSIQLTFIFLI